MAAIIFLFHLKLPKKLELIAENVVIATASKVIESPKDLNFEEKLKTLNLIAFFGKHLSLSRSIAKD